MYYIKWKKYYIKWKKYYINWKSTNKRYINSTNLNNVTQKNNFFNNHYFFNNNSTNEIDDEGEAKVGEGLSKLFSSRFKFTVHIFTMFQFQIFWNKSCMIWNKSCMILNKFCMILNKYCMILNKSCMIINKSCFIWKMLKKAPSKKIQLWSPSGPSWNFFLFWNVTAPNLGGPRNIRVPAKPAITKS